MQAFKALPPTQVQAQPTRQQVWTDASGTHFLVQREQDGTPSFLPLSPVPPQQLQPTAPARVTTTRDPLAMLLIGFFGLLGMVLAVYLIGFLAGSSGQRVVMVPREPVCTTRESGFLFWSSKTRECQ